MCSDRPRTAAQDGFTLVELLVAATLMVVVLSASLAALTSVERTQRKGSDRAGVLAVGRTGLERLTRELRQASLVYASPAPTATSLTVSTYVYSTTTATATKQNVTYTCSTTCTRTVNGTTQTLLTGVKNGDVFSFYDAAGTTTSTAASMRQVAIKIVFGLTGNKTATLTDGVDLRNGAA